MITVDRLTKLYRNGGVPVTAVKDVSFHVDKGEICSILGPSGCGKTTLLYILAGIIKDYQGSVYVNNISCRNQRPNVSLILQDYGLLPWKTVWQNVALGLEIRGVHRDEKDKKCERALKQVGLFHLKNMYPYQLSGGQKQRVAFARAISMDSNVLLMDEPFSALDELTREKAQQAFLNLWRNTGTTVLLVTHSIEEAVYLGSKILIMSSSPGKIIEEIINPVQGLKNARTDASFFRVCTRVRGIMHSA